MTCLPESGGCERFHTDAFVSFLNYHEGTQYTFVECLDVKDRRSPQPEALYIDRGHGKRLVVERKTLLWPENYAISHKNDHYVHDIVLESLGGLCDDKPYELQLPFRIEGKRERLRIFALNIASEIRSYMSALTLDNLLKSGESEYQWTFRLQRTSERDDDEPPTGVVVRWLVSQDDLSVNLRQQMDKIYRACAAKFRSYSGDRRCLLLDLKGELVFKGSDWLCKVLPQPPIELLTEVCAVFYGQLTDTDSGWMFSIIYPPESPLSGGVWID